MYVYRVSPQLGSNLVHNVGAVEAALLKAGETAGELAGASAALGGVATVMVSTHVLHTKGTRAHTQKEL